MHLDTTISPHDISFPHSEFSLSPLSPLYDPDVLPAQPSIKNADEEPTKSAFADLDTERQLAGDIFNDELQAQTPLIDSPEDSQLKLNIPTTTHHYHALSTNPSLTNTFLHETQENTRLPEIQSEQMDIRAESPLTPLSPVSEFPVEVDEVIAESYSHELGEVSGADIDMFDRLTMGDESATETALPTAEAEETLAPQDILDLHNESIENEVKLIPVPAKTLGGIDAGDETATSPAVNGVNSMDLTDFIWDLGETYSQGDIRDFPEHATGVDLATTQNQPTEDFSDKIDELIEDVNITLGDAPDVSASAVSSPNVAPPVFEVTEVQESLHDDVMDIEHAVDTVTSQHDIPLVAESFENSCAANEKIVNSLGDVPIAFPDHVFGWSSLIVS